MLCLDAGMLIQMHVTNECLDLFEVMNYIQRDEVYSKRTIKHYYLTKQLNNHYLNRCKSALKANPSLQLVVKFVISTPAYLKVIKMSVKKLTKKNKQTNSSSMAKFSQFTSFQLNNQLTRSLHPCTMTATFFLNLFVACLRLHF